MKSKKKIVLYIILFITIIIPNQIVFALTAQDQSDVFLMVESGCGNGYLEPGEVCDDGNNTDCDGCKSDCTRADNVCGDGYLDSSCGEQCDGSLGVTSGYTCNSLCQLVADTVPGGGIIPEIFSPLNIYNIYVRADINEALINWRTNKSATCRLEWGSTQALMDGIIESPVKKSDHRAYLMDLESATNYYFKIYCADSYGHKAETYIQKFQTLAEVDKKPPANVRDFTATPDNINIKIILTWQNPDDLDFRAVKIMRSVEFYPQNINEGIEVYNDSGEYTEDLNVEIKKRYYYTAFAYDNFGNYSSGAIASAIIIPPGEILPPEEIIPPEQVIPLPPGPPVPPEEMIAIELRYFEFYVANETIEISDIYNFQLLPGAILSVKTKEDFYPEVLKSIIITLAPKIASTTDQAVNNERATEAKSYLLRINEEEEKYNTVFTAPIKIKDYDIFLSFLNFSNSLIATTSAFMSVEKFGKVQTYDFSQDNKLSFIKSAQAQNSENTVNEIFAAEITLYKFEDERVVKWQGENYSQFNPIFSNQRGQYGFLVPNGRYYIKAVKDNYYKYTSLPFTVENNLVNNDIELIYYPMMDWKKWLYILLGFLLIYIILKKIFKKRVNKPVAFIPPNHIYPS